MERPSINVTPLIDILLVLLIVFMVVAPIKPSAFKVRLPTESNDHLNVPPDPQTLAVIINADLEIDLNGEKAVATVKDTSGLVARLKEVFELRGGRSGSGADSGAPLMSDDHERTVFIRAPKSLDYGSVARVVDAVKIAGAHPISLQIDRLN